MSGLAKIYFWWPDIEADIKNCTHGCQGCMQVANRPNIKPTHNWEWPGKPWVRVHADFAGLFAGYMWLILIDAHTKWPEVIRLNNTTSETTIKCLRSIFARFGIPEQLVTDNGPQWTSDLFAKFCINNNIRHTFTAPYHPASNGLAERGVQSFKKALLAAKSDNISDLDAKVQAWLLSYRTAPHSTTGKAPCELMFGRQIRTRLSILKHSVVIPRQSVPNTSGRQFMPGDSVFVTNHEKGHKWIEGVVEDPLGSFMYTVKTNKGSVNRNVTQMLPDRSNKQNTSGIQNEGEIRVSLPDANAHIETSHCAERADTAVTTLAEEPVVLRRSSRVPKPRQILDL